MPVSHWRHIDTVMRAVESVGADTILDIGPGFGKFGVLLRERFDIRFNRYGKKKWTTKIDCVEAWEPYISPLHRYIYNEIIIGNILDVVDSLGNYDIILFIDGLEHLEKEDGLDLVKKLYLKTNKLLLLSFPRTLNTRANSNWANPFERHLSLWNAADLINLFGDVSICSPTIFSIRKNAKDAKHNTLRA